MHLAAATEVDPKDSPTVLVRPLQGLRICGTTTPKAAQCLDPIDGCRYQPDSDGKTVCDTGGCQYTQR